MDWVVVVVINIIIIWLYEYWPRGLNWFNGTVEKYVWITSSMNKYTIILYYYIILFQLKYIQILGDVYMTLYFNIMHILLRYDNYYFACDIIIYGS